MPTTPMPSARWATRSKRCRRCAAGAKGSARPPARGSRLARLELAVDPGGDGGPAAVASIAVPGGAVEILPTDAIDLGAAERRIEQRRAELEADIARSEGKLANEGFVAKAPPQVVAAERDKLARLNEELAGL